MIRIALIGDVMLGRLVDDYIESDDGPCYVWGDARGIIRECELAICNLECVIADSGSPWHETSKAFHFRSHAKNIGVLTCAGIDAVTLANNHSLDFGETALSELLSGLNKAHIRHAGAGMSSEEATRPVMLKAGNINVGLLSFADSMPEWAANDGRAGIFYVPPDPSSPHWQELLKKVQQAKVRSDFLIVSPHWGPNWGYEVQPIYSTWAHGLIDAGADMIFGHSGHVPRGIEIYKHRPIIYSAGDFIDDYAISDEEPNDEGFVYVLELDDTDPVALRLHPTVIKNFQAQLAGSRAPRIAHGLLRLSEKFGTTGNFDPNSQVVTIAIQ
ncbi:MAG: CapA family protein [Candidatus Nanopelagicaceae bacterium]|nr:CapA family protein [Candidatus Nanopelagicaceae bacterium]